MKSGPLDNDKNVNNFLSTQTDNFDSLIIRNSNVTSMNKNIVYNDLNSNFDNNVTDNGIERDYEQNSASGFLDVEDNCNEMQPSDKIKVLDDVSIYFQNINRGRQKTNDIYRTVMTHEYDIVVLLETNLNDSFYNGEIFDDRYIVFRRDRNENTSAKKDGGGVLIAVMKKLNVCEVDVLHNECLEHVWLKIAFSKKNLYLCAIYLAPDVDIACYKMHVEDVKFVSDLIDINDDLIVCGDYNLSEVQWNLDSETDAMIPTNIAKDKSVILLENLSFCNLDQINSISNERGKFLDLVFSNITDNKINVKICEDPLVKLDRHHLAYEFIYDAMDYDFSPIECSKKIFDFSKADNREIVRELLECDWNASLDKTDINAASQSFSNILNKILDKNVPVRFMKKSELNKPWFNRSLKNLKNKRDRAAKIFRKFEKKCVVNKYNSLCQKCLIMKMKFVRLRNEFKRMHDLLYDSYIEHIENRIKNDPSAFFGFIDQKKKNVGFPSAMKYKNEVSSSPSTLCDLFAKFFSSVYVKPSDSSITDDFVCNIDESTNIDPINLEPIEIINALKQLDSKKGGGPDGIPPSILKNCSEGLVKPLTMLFNLSLQSGIFPTMWKSSYIVPIFKKGARDQIGNYRGIAILSSIPKLFEKIIFDRIYFNLKEKISTRQHGFMKGKSVVSNLMSFVSFCVNEIENGFQVDAVYTDFSKAFDCLNHKILLKKLHAYGFVSKMYAWIESYLSGRTQMVRIGNCISSEIQVWSGVPQGSHLGPLLFLLFINDIVKIFENVQALLYADDMKLFFVIKDKNDCEKIQSDLSRLGKWCECNKLFLNIDKCKSIVFGRGKNQIFYDYSLNGQILERVRAMNDLGVIVDERLDFIKHIDSIVAKSRKMLGFIMRASKEFDDPYALKSLYVSLVRSKLEFASCVWNPNYSVHVKKIERIQEKFLKYALRRMGWKNVFELPPYESRCMLLNLNTLERRREIGNIMFIRDLVCGRVICPYLLNNINFLVSSYRTRASLFIYPNYHRTNYGLCEPLNNSILLFNKSSQYFDFNNTRNKFHDILKQL
jgi:Reverse transcriptase (RNA-dependent DNA polymerase)